MAAQAKGPSIIIDLLHEEKKSFVYGWVGQGEFCFEKY